MEWRAQPLRLLLKWPTTIPRHRHLKKMFCLPIRSMTLQLTPSHPSTQPRKWAMTGKSFRRPTHGGLKTWNANSTMDMHQMAAPLMAFLLRNRFTWSGITHPPAASNQITAGTSTDPLKIGHTSKNGVSFLQCSLLYVVLDHPRGHGLLVLYSWTLFVYYYVSPDRLSTDLSLYYVVPMWYFTVWTTCYVPLSVCFRESSSVMTRAHGRAQFTSVEWKR